MGARAWETLRVPFTNVGLAGFFSCVFEQKILRKIWKSPIFSVLCQRAYRDRQRSVVSRIGSHFYLVVAHRAPMGTRTSQKVAGTPGCDVRPAHVL